MNPKEILAVLRADISRAKSKARQEVINGLVKYCPKIFDEYKSAEIILVNNYAMKVGYLDGDDVFVKIPTHGSKKEERPYTYMVNQFLNVIKQGEFEDGIFLTFKK